MHSRLLERAAKMNEVHSKSEHDLNTERRRSEHGLKAGILKQMVLFWKSVVIRTATSSCALKPYFGCQVTHGGGSLTALPVIETQAGDVSAYIPTNVWIPR